MEPVVTPNGNSWIPNQELAASREKKGIYLTNDKGEIEFHPYVEDDWQTYWGNQGAASVSNAMHHAAPVVATTLTAPLML